MTFKVAPMCSKVHTIGNSGESRLLVPGLEELRAERAESLISAELRAEIEQREEQ